MNIHIPHSWLQDYIKTNATPQQIAAALSLHAFSVEKIEKWNDGDSIYEIEITPNRGDALSVQGIAREAYAALKRTGISVEWAGEKSKNQISKIKNKDKKLKVEIQNKSLVPRFSAIVLSNVKIGPSPKIIQERLEKVGIRAIDNVVDVTNYFMIDKGQPMHSFDYDKIKGGKMIVRESGVGSPRQSYAEAKRRRTEAGESIITLDGVKRELPKGVIVIEDGEGRLIDLCGIMGAQNSQVDKNTKNVLLFVQIYDPVKIRKASMSLGHRTDAAVRFEKGIDPQAVVPSLWEAVEMLKENAGAEVASELIDIVNEEYKEKKVLFDYKKIEQVAGTAIPEKEVTKYLNTLGINIEKPKANSQGLKAVIPSWRASDIEIPEDLAEEVIRLYGYYNLPNKLLTGEIPLAKESETFYWENRIKTYLKYQGFIEVYTTSATSKELAEKNALKLANPLSKDFEYLRTSLIPQITQVVNQNKGFSDTIKLFELAAVYLPKKGDLPDQPLKVALVTKGVGYRVLKGIIGGLLNELGYYGAAKIFPTAGVQIEQYENILSVELDLDTLIKNASRVKPYTPISKFAPIKEDLTLVVPAGVSYYDIENVVSKTDDKIEKVNFKTTYQNTMTIAIQMLDREKQIDAKSADLVRQNVLNILEKELGVKLKN